MPTTPRLGIAYPDLAAAPHGPEQIAAVALAADAQVQHLQSTAISRPPAGTSGRLHRATDTGAWSLDTGAAWVVVPTGTAVLASTGGRMTGDLDMDANRIEQPSLSAWSQRRVVIAAAGAARTLTPGVQGQVIDLTLDAACTITFAIGTSAEDLDTAGLFRADDAITWDLIIRQPAGGFAVTWPASITWIGDSVPALTASRKHYLSFRTLNNGADVTGWYIGSSGGLGD